MITGALAQKKANRMPDIRQARLLSAELLHCLEDTPDLTTARLEDFEYPYFIFNLSGTVLMSQNEQVKENDLINPKEFTGMREDGKNFDFVSPVMLKDRQVATAVITYPIDLIFLKSNEIGWIVMMSVLLLMLLGVCFCFYRFLESDILIPIQELHITTKAILNGDYEEKLAYDFDSEIGTLCHDFEKMRDELKVSKQAELKLHEKEKLLLACISHDLKTPLSAISGYVEGIRDGIAKTPEAIQSYTNTILKKVRMLSKLIDDILEHSKTELNEFSIEKQEIYSQDYFLNVCSDLSLDVEKNGIHFRINEVPNVMIMIDPYRMTQVMQNLISNAIKHTPKGGHISVLFELGVQQLAVSVTDDGRGINAEDIPFVFDKFYRGEKARTLNVSGSGLGLTITKYIIEKHQGKIECDSLLGSGTTIRFWIPL